MYQQRTIIKGFYKPLREEIKPKRMTIYDLSDDDDDDTLQEIDGYCGKKCENKNKNKIKKDTIERLIGKLDKNMNDKKELKKKILENIEQEICNIKEEKLKLQKMLLRMELINDIEHNKIEKKYHMSSQEPFKMNQESLTMFQDSILETHEPLQMNQDSISETHEPLQMNQDSVLDMHESLKMNQDSIMEMCENKYNNMERQEREDYIRYQRKSMYNSNLRYPNIHVLYIDKNGKSLYRVNCLTNVCMNCSVIRFNFRMNIHYNHEFRMLFKKYVNDNKENIDEKTVFGYAFFVRQGEICSNKKCGLFNDM